MIAPVTHILPLTLIQRERTLPIPGKVVVRTGQKIAARDVIAEADLAPEHFLLNIARGLGISNQEADSLVQRKEGDTLNEGDLIAGPVGLTRKVVRAPVNGTIKLVGEGQVLIQIEKEPYKLRAGMVGRIKKLIPDFGAVVETSGALIQGIWGNGLADFGLMQVRLEKPTDEITSSKIDVSLRGSIIVGGYLNDPAVFTKASSIPVKGLILTSMPASLMKTARTMTYPIIILEGFGKLPLNQISYNLLTAHHNREVALNANIFNHDLGRRPEVIVPLPSERELGQPIPLGEFAIGQQVRLIRRPHHARIGRIDYLYDGIIDFPNGIRAPGARVSLENGENLRVPLKNMEIIA